MSLAETETANVESINRAKSEQRFGLTGLKQFARVGLDLKIGEFRQMCEELGSRLHLADADSQGDAQLAGAVADILFDWMTDKLEQDAGK